MSDLERELYAALKRLSSAVELIDGHHPQRKTRDDDCEICAAQFVAREVIQKAETK